MRIFYNVIISIIIIGGPYNLFAHGSKYEIINPGIGIKASYFDGSVMSDSDVEVYSTANSKKTTFTGITDSKGRFHFFPDKTGKWRITISDGMGHAVEALVNVGNDMIAESAPANNKGAFSTLQIFVMAICVIWGFIGTGLYFKRNKQG